jgi:hypothetical protein
MARGVGERLKELQRTGEEIEAGGTLSVWLPEELVLSLTALASEVGISRSALARELLTVGVPQAWEEVRPDLEQYSLPLDQVAVEAGPGEFRRLKARPGRVRKPAAKRARKAVAGRSRAKGK